MPIGYGVPRAKVAVPDVPAGVFPVPSNQMLMQQLRAQKHYERLGVPWQPGGLLDRFPDRIPTELMPNQGLLTPVIWDRVRKGLLQTEGAPRGGGGGGRTTSVPQAGRRPPFVDWSYSENTGMYATTTPAGIKVTARPRYTRAGREGVDVEFDMPKATFHGPKGEYAKGPEGMSIKRGISHISEAFRATKEFVKKFNPDQIAFSGEGKRATIYEKLAPDLAKALGGELRMYGKGNVKEFRIDLPEKVK